MCIFEKKLGIFCIICVLCISIISCGTTQTSEKYEMLYGEPVDIVGDMYSNDYIEHTVGFCNLKPNSTNMAKVSLIDTITNEIYMEETISFKTSEHHYGNILVRIDKGRLPIDKIYTIYDELITE